MQILKGPYLGDVTALCFVRPPWDAAFPMVLAGTGAQVACYDLVSREQHFSVHVFDGIRVHGIHSVRSNAAPAVELVAVHGERRVKLFRMVYENRASLQLWQVIPRFTKWVLDVRFLKVSRGNGGTYKLLAIGLSDNSVSLWDLSLSRLVHHVQCSERCLLYSMRLWGESAENLRIAAGTIYNEVLAWTSVQTELTQVNVKNCDWKVSEAKPIRKFCGHEGSIYRISWSENGDIIGSVSDDRSARIWKYSDDDPQDTIVLFGHTARVWDLHIDEKLLITASEDCTCGVWSLKGQLLRTLKGHFGRGVWRCIFDPQASLLVTAGADASIKVYSVSEHVIHSDNHDKSENQLNFFQINFEKIEGHRDSKSEYVRCINFAGPSSFFFATNQGLLQHVSLEVKSFKELKRKVIFQTDTVIPIVCMDLLEVSSKDEHCQDVYIACGDGQGRATVLRVSTLNTADSQVICQSTWLAEEDRQLLGIFWCKHLGSRYVFTTDPKGGVRCWVLEYGVGASFSPRLLAYFKSSLCSRIVCLDASSEKQLLVCGDQKGNLVLFKFPDNSESTALVDERAFCRGAHGLSAVASVSISSASDKQTKILSTGRDGCICEMLYETDDSSDDRTSSKILCGRVEKMAAITVVESLFQRNVGSGSIRRVAVGFAAADFVLWDITNEVELKRIICGGWKRPHSYLIGEVPETQFCFAFVKDQSICIYHIWNDSNDPSGTLQLQALQRQSHGREVHAVLFTPDSGRDVDWLLTGAEDGLVQILRYSGEKLTVMSSLEEHVCGSAVRALALCSHIYDSRCTSRGTSKAQDGLLFSAGAKEVLTCWLLANQGKDQISSRWLSTLSTSNRKTQQKDDLRYLAVTVFAVHSTRGTAVYFVVAALSNVLLTLRAFDLSNRTWHHVAVLEHHNAPVLALHHTAFPSGSTGANEFVVFSGSTDGTIAVWDLTGIVDHFISESGKVKAEEHAELRPRSGRGSQGGKARYRLHHHRNQEHGSKQELKPAPFAEATKTQQSVVKPAAVLPACHQSGVNTLHVSCGSRILVVSGGDDQGLHCATLSMEGDERSPFKILSQQIVSNAHSSAVKGVWSDGERVFSTGLDQRLRCWIVDDSGAQLTESCSCIIDVPETEALHARNLKRGCYRIAIVGRGLQILDVNFS